MAAVYWLGVSKAQTHGGTTVAVACWITQGLEAADLPPGKEGNHGMGG